MAFSYLLPSWTFYHNSAAYSIQSLHLYFILTKQSFFILFLFVRFCVYIIFIRRLLTESVSFFARWKSNPHFSSPFYEHPVIFSLKWPLFHILIHIFTSVIFFFRKKHSCLFWKIKYFIYKISTEIWHFFLQIIKYFSPVSGMTFPDMIQYMGVKTYWLYWYYLHILYFTIIFLNCWKDDIICR